MPAFDLNKATSKAKFTLEKRGIPDVKAAVCLNLDVSGSARSLFSSGQIQEAFQLLVPISVLFDDNQSLQVFTFASGNGYTTEISPDATAANYSDYISRNILNNSAVPKWGGTDYTPVLHQNLVRLGFVKKTLFGGSKFVRDNGSGYPALIITLTDGRNDDHAKTSGFLKECEDAGVQAYFLFLGVGTADFSNIVKYADDRSNVGFLSVRDLAAFSGSDDVYDLILGEELVEWFKKK